MFVFMVFLFVLGYLIIALEHPLKIDKAATALILGALSWTVYMLGSEQILSMVNNSGTYVSSAWAAYLTEHGGVVTKELMTDFISHNQLLEHLGEIAEILFFLLGAMTIVEIVDQHEGFKVITDRIKTTNKVKLMWIIGFLTFFMSSVLDNLTTTIVIIALLRKLIDDKHTRWFFASLVVIAANAGGAWSPIGDVTTIMLWIGGQVTAIEIMKGVFIASMLNMVVPMFVIGFFMKGEITRPEVQTTDNDYSIPGWQSKLILAIGVGALLFVPVFKTATHLPPYIGMLLGLGVLWVATELIHRNNHTNDAKNLSVVGILRRVDVPTVLFFLGILLAVAALQSAGQLQIMAKYLDDKLGNVYLIGLAIGLLSAIIDNVPLVAGAMGMYPIEGADAVGYARNFMADGTFWELIAYTAGTGGSILIIGSAAGVAAMGLEKIDFIWYLKRISWLALLGYLAGAGAYYLEHHFLYH